MRVPLAALVVLSLVATAGAAPLVPALLVGFGSATTFQVFGSGGSVQGGAYEWNDLCGYCWILITVFDGTLLDADDSPSLLDPGVYEIREFRGVFSHTQQGLGNHAFQLEGVGKMHPVG